MRPAIFPSPSANATSASGSFRANAASASGDASPIARPAAAENPREGLRERVRRLGVFHAPEHRLEGVLVAQRERTEVDGAARAVLGRRLELQRERGDEPLGVRHEAGREERRRAFRVGGHQQERVQVLRDERLLRRRVAQGRELDEIPREVADRLALGRRKLRGGEREVLDLLRRLEVLRRVELFGRHRRRVVAGGAVLRPLEEQRDLVEDALLLRAAVRLEHRLELPGHLAVAALDGREPVVERIARRAERTAGKERFRVLRERPAEELLELVLLRWRRLGNLVLPLLRDLVLRRRLRDFVLRRRLDLAALLRDLVLRRRLHALRRLLDILPVPAGVGDLVRVIDDVLDALLAALVALLDFADGLGDDLDVDRVPERVVARGPDRVLRPLGRALGDIAGVAGERLVVELVQQLLPDARERPEDRLRDRAPETGVAVLADAAVLLRVGQHRAEALPAEKRRVIRNLPVELPGDLRGGDAEVDRQRLAADPDRRHEARRVHRLLGDGRERDRAERRLDRLRPHLGIGGEGGDGVAQHGERPRLAVEARVGDAIECVLEKRVVPVQAQARQDLHHVGAGAHGGQGGILARLARKQREELLVRRALAHQRRDLGVHTGARVADLLRIGGAREQPEAGIVAEDVAHLLAGERREALLQGRADAGDRRPRLRREAELRADVGEILLRDAAPGERLEERLLHRHGALRVDGDGVARREGDVVVDLLEAGDLALLVGLEVDLAGVVGAVRDREEVVERDGHGRLRVEGLKG